MSVLSVGDGSLTFIMSIINKVSSPSFIILLLSVAAQTTLVSGFIGFSPASLTTNSHFHVLLKAAEQSAVFAAETNTETTLDSSSIATKLLETCSEYGQVGSKLTEEERAIIDDIAASLNPSSSPSPAKIELTGKHELIYSASPSASSGALGPLTGKVTQSFLDETKFINRVEFFAGAFKIELYAERKVLDDTRIRVKFKETVISLLGQEVKRFEAKGSGIWDYVFAGPVTTPSGEKMLLRVMKTPSTFVIVQKE